MNKSNPVLSDNHVVSGSSDELVELRFANAIFVKSLTKLVELNSLTMVNISETPSYIKLDSEMIARSIVDGIHRQLHSLGFKTVKRCALQVSLLAIQCECLDVDVHPFIKKVLREMNFLAEIRRC